MNPHFDELSLYLDDQLSPIRRAAFEALLEVDPELREALSREKAFRKAQQTLADSQSKTGLDEQRPDTTKSKVFDKWYNFVLLILLAIMVYFFFFKW